MTLNEASDFFKKLLTETDKKSEFRIYQKFISILSDLKNKTFTQQELQAIENELDTLELKVSSENSIKDFKRKLRVFLRYLKENFSFITEGYYTGIGITMGICFGVAFGAAFKKPGSGLAVGIAIGLVIGGAMDSKAKKEGKVLKTNLK